MSHDTEKNLRTAIQEGVLTAQHPAVHEALVALVKRRHLLEITANLMFDLALKHTPANCSAAQSLYALVHLELHEDKP